MKIVALGFWEEHCIECGAPACYKSCDKFKRRFGGTCLRIDHNKFLPWGKLELYWQGKGVSRVVYKAIGALTTVVRPLFCLISKETWFRGLRRRIASVLGTRFTPKEWIIECVAEHNESLVASIVNLEKEELMIRRLELKTGRNSIHIQLPDLAQNVFFRISSIDGTRGRVTFLKNDIGISQDYSKSSEYVKCVVWDLDNTLWDGILANDGDDVRLREDTVRVIKELDARGIVSTIASKNDRQEACAKLTKLGLLDYFVFPRINWNPKSENIKKIAKDINIGLNTLAFVDDSDHERGEVKENLPMVRVFSEREIVGLLHRHEFCPPTSSESGKRRLSYLAEMKRKADEEESEGNHEDFIRKCEIELECVRINDEATRKRCWELVNRTNQLTLAARRYTEAEFGSLLTDAECYAVKCHDKYGDYGIVGFVAVAKGEVFEFVMSCRVAKKYCEQSVLLAFADKLKAIGVNRMMAIVVPTGRNIALIEAFRAMPFEYSEVDGELRFELELANSTGWEGVFRNKVIIGDYA